MEYTLDGILILDPMGKILFANQAAGRLIGAENYHEMFGIRNVLEFIAPESQGDAVRDFTQVAKGIDGYFSRYKVITTTDQERWAESIGKSIRFGDAPAILVSLRDITDRQRAEEELIKKNEDLHAAYEELLLRRKNSGRIMTSSATMNGRSVPVRRSSGLLSSTRLTAS